MNLPLREVFNIELDKLVGPEVPVLRRSLSAFRVCGVMGLGLAILIAMILVIYSGLSPLVMAGLVVAAVSVFFGLVMATKIITGEEKIIYYHHEIAVMVVAALFLWLMRQPILPFLDITILGIGTGLFCGRIGCLMVGCCHGRPYHWGVCYRPEHAEAGFTPYLVGVRLFPIQAVESLWVFCIVVLGITLILRGWPPGTALAWYVVAYDTGRFCFEFVRGDPDRPYLWGFSQPQWISVVLMWFVVWAEITGALPFQWWHSVVTAGLMLAMITITLKRRFQKTARYDLLHPRHVREVAEALRLFNGTEDKTQNARGWTVLPRSSIPTTLHLACTSLGVQISAGRVRDVASDLHHYTFSCRNGGMTEETARTLADLVLQLQRANDKGELVNGNRHVFHLLVRPFSGKERVC
jgi:Prolipoprotein diacylglyceryl transferase